MRRPGWSAWALGAERHERLSVETPVAQIVDRWPTGAQPRIRFDMPVSTVTVGGKHVTTASASVALPAKTAAGAVNVRAAARAWEKLGPPVRVTWFPRSPPTGRARRPRARRGAHPADAAPPDVLADRLVGARERSPAALAPPAGSLGTARTATRSSSSRAATAHRSQPTRRVRFPKPVRVLGGTTWHIAPASFLRLQQLLAQEGYLPVTWSPTASDVPLTKRAELAAATAPPAGTFSWRYENTPPELTALWTPGEPNTITRGAVMMFQHDHGLTVDAIAGPAVWHAAIADAIAGRQKLGGYSYVYVHRNVPQLLTLWHSGHVVMTSPGNTGVPAAPTQLGTWPVFEHIPVGTHARHGTRTARTTTTRASAGSATSTAARHCTRSTARRSARRRASAASSCRSPRRRRCGPTRRSARSSRSRTRGVDRSRDCPSRAAAR